MFKKPRQYKCNFENFIQVNKPYQPKLHNQILQRWNNHHGRWLYHTVGST